MLRNIHLTSGEVFEKFVDSVEEIIETWQHKMKYLNGVGEDERTKAHHTIKILESYFNRRGNTGI